MKHRIIGLIIIVLVGSVGLVSAQENLLVNGDLEDGVVDPWVSYMVDLEMVDELVGAAIPDVPYQGSHCLHATVATVGGNFWERWIKPNNNELVFETSKKYAFSAFIKSSQGIFRIRIKPEKSAEGYGSAEVAATDVTFNDPPLSWKVTELGAGFNVYLGTDFDDVNSGDTGALVAQGLEGTTLDTDMWLSEPGLPAWTWPMREWRWIWGQPATGRSSKSMPPTATPETSGAS
jgi:hypothetical protein